MMRSWKALASSLLLLLPFSAGAQTLSALSPAITPQVMRVSPQTLPPSAPTTGSHVLDKVDVDAWLDGYMPYALRVGDIPGAVATVVKDGQILTSRGFGYADVAKRIPVNADTTLFRPGSVSKLVTWTAVMQLVEAGKIDLDKDVNTYLDFHLPPHDGPPITMRNIMTHTAGFNEVSKNTIYYSNKRQQSLGDYLKASVPSRIYTAGTTPAYSNWATALAGYIVERVSGMPFDDYVDQRIFQPLGMKSASFREPLPPALMAQLSKGYMRGTEPPTPFEYIGPAPAGSLAVTGTDMGRFMIAHLQDGMLNGQRILNPSTAEMMHNSPLNRINSRSLIPPLNRMELGFFETNINGHEVIGHLGDTEVFHTSLHLFLRDGVGLFISFNSRGKDAAVGTLRTAMFQDFADRYFPGTSRDGRVPPAVAAQHARMMTGLWDASRATKGNFLELLGLAGQARIAIGADNGLLIKAVAGPNGAPRHWTEIVPFVWRDADGHDRLAAQVENGKVVRWSYDLASPFEVFDRVPAYRSSGWIIPALVASIAILLLTLLYWPAAWFVRRRYSSEMTATGRSRSAYRATRIFAGLDLAVLGGWLAAISAMLGDVNKFTAAFDPVLWFLQISGLVVFGGAVIVSAINLAFTWQDGRRWTRKFWNTLVLLAALMLFYVAAVFGLIAMTVRF